MSTDTGREPVTKIGTEVFGVRVVSGAVHHDEPGSIVLRQLYPGRPADIGVIDSIAEGTGQTTIYPGHRRDWTDHDRARLAEFFAARYAERFPGRFPDHRNGGSTDSYAAATITAVTTSSASTPISMSTSAPITGSNSKSASTPTSMPTSAPTAAPNPADLRTDHHGARR